MAKFKKLTIKYMCILSSLVICFSAMFLPFEEFKANESSVSGTSTSGTWAPNFSYTDLTSKDTNVMVQPTYSESDVAGGMIQRYTYYYFYSGYKNILTTSSSVYAYRIYVQCNSVSKNTVSGCLESRMCLGKLDQYMDMTLEMGTTFSAGNAYPFWYINEYENGQSIYLSAMYSLYDLTYTSGGTSYYSYPDIALTANCTYTIVPYTIDDLTDEIYTTLTNIYNNDVQMLNYLKSIYSSVDTVETKLQNLYTIANSQLSYLKEIDSNTDELEALLNVCNSALADIKVELEEQTTWLEKIWISVQEFINPNSEDKDKTSSFNSEVKEQSNEIDVLSNEMDNFVKPDIDSFVPDVGSQIPVDSDDVLEKIFGIVWGFNLPTSYLLLTCMFVVIAYVFFGKR